MKIIIGFMRDSLRKSVVLFSLPHDYKLMRADNVPRRVAARPAAKPASRFVRLYRGRRQHLRLRKLAYWRSKGGYHPNKNKITPKGNFIQRSTNNILPKSSTLFYILTEVKFMNVMLV
jgi:hypothetical protein